MALAKTHPMRECVNNLGPNNEKEVKTGASISELYKVKEVHKKFK